MEGQLKSSSPLITRPPELASWETVTFKLPKSETILSDFVLPPVVGLGVLNMGTNVGEEVGGVGFAVGIALGTAVRGRDGAGVRAGVGCCVGARCWCSGLCLCLW